MILRNSQMSQFKYIQMMYCVVVVVVDNLWEFYLFLVHIWFITTKLVQAVGLLLSKSLGFSRAHLCWLFLP